MNLSFFISKRITSTEKGSFSSTIHKIAVGSIGLGLAVMIVSFMILNGFQDTVKNKIYNFNGHLQITRYSQNGSYEESPFSLDNHLYQNYEQYDFVDHVQSFAHLVGLVKRNEDLTGIIFKGVGKKYDQERFQENILSGRFIEFDTSSYSKEIMVSKIIAKKLRVDLDSQIVVHFFGKQSRGRPRKLKVVGIYETNLSDYFDNKVIIGDLGLVQRLNNWGDSLAGGMEVFIKDVDQTDEAEIWLDNIIEYDLISQKIKDKFIQVFEWLYLISRQVNIFLAIILLVVCVNMISIVLILIMERTQMIGLLKAFGATHGQIRKIFVFNGMQLVVKGLVIGNLLGIGLCFIQYYFKVIPLNPHDYYMSYVPIGWDSTVIVALNLLTFVVVSLIILIPSAVVSRINPIKSIRFD